MVVKLGEIATIESGQSAPQDLSFFENGVYPFFRVSDLANKHQSSNLIEVKDKLNDKGIMGLKLFKKGSILFPKSGATTFLNHRAIMGCDGYVVSHLAIISVNEEKVFSKYIYYYLCHIDAKDLILNDSYPSIRQEELEQIKVYLPDLSTQQEIVNQIEQEEKIIEENKKLIEIMENKMQKKIEKLLK